MQKRVGKSGCFAWIVALSFAVGGVMEFFDFADALIGGPSTATRRTVQADESNVMVALILVVGTVGLVGLAYRYSELRDQVGLRFLIAWTLMLIAGVLYNLLPVLFDISRHTQTLLTTPPYGAGALLFVWWLVWPPRFLVAPESAPDTQNEM